MTKSGLAFGREIAEEVFRSLSECFRVYRSRNVNQDAITSNPAANAEISAATAESRRLIAREAGIQGARWNTLHGGYFSDPAAARPLVEAVLRAAAACAPSAVVDLGGGTGFVLGELLARLPAGGPRLVNVDCSDKQLAECSAGGVERLCRSVTEVTRGDLDVGDGRLMLIMRSLLHYFAREGLRPMLQRLREQMRPGEAFVHQTACFAEARGADCFNLLYRRMKSEKWYPTLAELRGELEAAGWTVREATPAPAAPLTGADLMERYSLSAEETRAIGGELAAKFGPIPGVFSPAPDGLAAWLHYFILTCECR
jgi:SAM-dependent methyltransferase